MKLVICLCCGQCLQKPRDPLDRFPHICLRCETIPDDEELSDPPARQGTEESLRQPLDHNEQWTETA